MRWCCLLGIALCVALAGCDEAALMKRFIPPGEELIARDYADLLQQRKFDEIAHDMDSSLVDSNLPDALAQMAALFPAESPESIKVVGAHFNKTPEAYTVDITLEYQFPSKWLLVSVVTEQKGDVRRITGFHVTPIADSLENLNRFTLAGKNYVQYFTLVCAIASVLFTLYVFALCVAEKNVRAKWLWLIIVLTGVGKLAVNWGTGAWTCQLIAVAIPCFSMTHPFYSPWTIAAYLPLGAIVFLHLRWKRKSAGELMPPVVDDPALKSSVPS